MLRLLRAALAPRSGWQPNWQPRSPTTSDSSRHGPSVTAGQKWWLDATRHREWDYGSSATQRTDVVECHQLMNRGGRTESRPDERKDAVSVELAQRRAKRVALSRLATLLLLPTRPAHQRYPR